MDPPLPRQESSGALPEIADVQPADMERYIKPIIKEMYAEIKSAVKEHMALVKSQYETGLSKASRDGSFSTVNVLDISAINPVSDPTGPTPVKPAGSAGLTKTPQ